MWEDPVVAPSALKHGITRDDVLHAFRNPIRMWDLGDGFTMMVGASRSGKALEVGCVDSDAAPVIVHAMPARAKFLR